MKVLIVDDEPDARMLMGDILEPLNPEVQEACDGDEALKILKQNPSFDIALVDWRMPGSLSGVDLVQAIRADSAVSSMPLIMVTGKNDLEDVQNALDAGATEFLMKPYTREMVMDKLRMVGFEIPEAMG